MTVRELKPSDVEAIRAIHAKFYADEFAFPDFFNQFICAFALVDSEEKIVVAGGIRPIIESVIITDQDTSAHKRTTALFKTLEVSQYLTKLNGFNQLHAFVQDKTWERALRENKFVPTKGIALVLEL